MEKMSNTHLGGQIADYSGKQTPKSENSNLI